MRNLRDIYQQRPDLQKEFSTFGGRGASGDWTMQDWWKRHGQAEYPGVSFGEANAPPIRPKTTAMQSFNSALMGMLQKYQGLDSSKLLKQKRALLKAQYKKGAEVTPQERRALSPGQQAAIRGGQVGALQPELEGVIGEIGSREQAMSRFTSMMGMTRQIAGDIANLQEKQRSQSFDAVKIMAQSGLDFNALPQDQVAEIMALTGIEGDVMEGYYNRLKDISDIEVQIKRKKLVDKPTVGDKQVNERASIEQELSASKGENGFTDSSVYKRLQLDYSGSPTEFDNYFGYMLSPEDRQAMQAGRWKPAKGEVPGELDESQIEQITELYEESIGEKAFKKLIESGTINVNGEDIKLTDEQKEKFLEALKPQHKWRWPWTAPFGK